MADPFWQAESIQLIPPAMLQSVPGRPVAIRSSGKDQVMAVDRAFDLSAAQLEPLRKNTQTEQLHVSPSNHVCMLEARPCFAQQRGDVSMQQCRVSISFLVIGLFGEQLSVLSCMCTVYCVSMCWHMMCAYVCTVLQDSTVEKGNQMQNFSSIAACGVKMIETP